LNVYIQTKYFLYLPNNLKKEIMKKIYTLLFTAILGFSATAQNPIITTVLDGPCAGGLPKLLEIYASGTVDFTQFTLQNQTNASVTWGSPQDLAAFGTKTNQFVYVILTGGATSVVTTEFPNVTAANSIESSTLNLNGDDRLRIINTATSVVIDQFGVSDVDGTGTPWEWVDTYAKRVNGTGPDAGFIQANWIFSPINTLDGLGACLGGAALSTIVTLENHNLSVAQNQIDGLKIYPNPVTNGTFYINTNTDSTKQVIVYDVLGKQVVQTATTNAVNVSNLKGGVYIVKITEEGKTATRKLVIR
jgi:hypothetical protein